MAQLYNLRAAQEKDLPAISQLVLEAMRGDVLNHSLFPSGPDFSEQQQEQNRLAWYEDLWRRQLTNPNAWPLVVHTQRDTNDIIGFACWNFAEGSVPSERAPGKGVVEEALGKTVPRGMSEAGFRECIEKLEGVKAQVLDQSRDCYHLTMLVTSPAQERRGIGTMLFRWAVERADAEDALVYLEATPVGLGLYKGYGCEQVARVDFSGGGKRIIMIRQPKAGN